ncbi:MAG: flavodoxin family protein [Candidatus Izemoplasmataceae bacterium]
MKKAIVYYSKTGNTKSVVDRFQGFDVLEVKAESDDPNHDPVLTSSPSISDYEYVVFASPVHGFQLCKIMKAYLKQLGSLKGKKINLFITHYFRFAFLGGNQALKQMRKLVEEKEGQVDQMISVNWKAKDREEVIKKVISEYSKN